MSKIAFAFALAAVWIVAPIGVRAQDGDDDESHSEQRGQEGRGPRGGERMGGGGEGGGRGEHQGGMGGMMGKHEPDPAMREKFMKMRELEKKVREAAQKMRRGTDSEKASARTQAKALLGELLDAKLAMEEDMLAKLEKRMAELKEKIAKKRANRNKMIESRLSHLSGDGDDW